MRRSGAVTLLAAGTVLAAAAVVAVDTAHAGTARTMAGAAAAPRACPTGSPTGSPLPSYTVRATKIRDGFAFLEGPVWHAASGSLFFSDLQNAAGPQRVQPAAIRRFTPPGTFDTFVADAGSNGLAIGPDPTTLLAATHDRRSVSGYRLADRTRSVVVAADGQGRRFNSPNDLTVRADGTIYFTDPNFQRGNRPDEQGGRTGVFRISPSGTVTLVDDRVAQPNGIVLSPDERSLYVGGNADNRIFRYPVRADGSTGPRTEFAAVTGADGATVDCAGNIYWTSYNDGRVHVFDPTGRKLGTITAGRNTTNVAFGGTDGQTLFITSGSTGNFGLYSVRLALPGNPY